MARKLSLNNAFKGTQKNAVAAGTVALVIFGSRKVIDLSKLMDNMNIPNDSYIRKNSGLVKVGMGIVAANMFDKRPIIKGLAWGVAVDGMLQWLGQAQANKNNNSGGGSGNEQNNQPGVNEQPADMSAMIEAGVAGPGRMDAAVAGPYETAEEMETMAVYG